jgi:hypothetical protein
MADKSAAVACRYWLTSVFRLLEKSALGNFDDASITHFGVTSTFYRKDEKFLVRTDGPDGKREDIRSPIPSGFTHSSDT